jgi:hypothetical protein
MREVWQADAPTEAEVAAARRRTLRRMRATDGSRPGASSVRLPFDLALGMAGAAVLIFVLTKVIPSEREPAELAVHVPQATEVPAGDMPAGTPESRPSTPEESRGLEQAPPRIERDGVVVEVAPGTEFEVARGQTVTVIMGGQRTQVMGPRLIEFTFEADRASGFRMHLSTPASAETQGEESPKPAIAPEDSAAVSAGSGAKLRAEPPRSVAREELSAWRRAAQAMRQGDEAEAQRALGELTRSSSAANRDAAALALAQLRMASGQDALARPELERLSREGATELVRRRARELLRR